MAQVQRLHKQYKSEFPDSPLTEDDFKKQLSSSLAVALRKELKEQSDALALGNESDYSNPNWALLRADRDGQRRALQQILKLLEI